MSPLWCATTASSQTPAATTEPSLRQTAGDGRCHYGSRRWGFEALAFTVAVQAAAMEHISEGDHAERWLEFFDLCPAATTERDESVPAAWREPVRALDVGSRHSTLPRRHQ
jgi:hypothetical protein